MQKIIFLDFDGVITTMASRYALDRHKCDLLQQIIDRTGAKIVDRLRGGKTRPKKRSLNFATCRPASRSLYPRGWTRLWV